MRLMDRDPDLSQWLPDELVRPSESPSAPPPESSSAAAQRERLSQRWTPSPDPQRAAAPSDAQPQDAPAPDQSQLPEINRLRDEVQRLATIVETLAAKVEDLERDLRAEAEAGKWLSQEAVEAVEARSPTQPLATEEGVSEAPSENDLNRVTFEDLRRLGLSVSQAARFVSQREARGGFKSLDELNQLYGFPRDQIAALKQAGTVSGGVAGDV
jgi:DNA uptake protein ComE-like DNA-binding protein